MQEYLIKVGGVGPAKITAVGHRALYPVAQNRRVEINIIAD